MRKNFRSIAKAAINLALAPLGLEVKLRERAPLPPVPGRDPLEAISLRRSGVPAALECDIRHCVIFNGFSLGPDSWHPFVATLDEAANEAMAKFSGSILERYYDVWQPADALDSLIGAALGPNLLRDFPAYAVHSPWIEATPDERALFMARAAELENQSFGAPSMRIDEGYGLQGPVSEAKGALEYKRLLDLRDSIREAGYLRDRGDITAMILKRGAEYRFRIAHGQHRAAVLAHLGHNSLIIDPTMLIERDEVEHWPQVYRGNWSRPEALEYFDHLFDFDARGWARAKGLV